MALRKSPNVCGGCGELHHPLPSLGAGASDTEAREPVVPGGTETRREPLAVDRAPVYVGDRVGTGKS